MLEFDEYATRLEATRKDGRLEGKYDRGARGSYPFLAQRFVPVPLTDTDPPSIADQLENPTRLHAFIRRYQIEYPVLLAGEPRELTDKMLGANAILAYEVNGQPLPVAHGFPVRLLVPGYYGVCNVKFLDRIDLAADRLMTRFMARDYVTIMGREVNGRTEWIETSVTKLRVKSVTARVMRSGPRFKVFGAAWSDGTPLKGVDVQIDGGAWQPATLERQNNPFAWTFWSYDMPALGAGEHTVVSRATDQRGRTQPDDLNMKKTIWENNELFPRKMLVS